ncbi:carbohydrate deacetylase isoform X2 [Notamacropus eugenii]|uniref:carbohydrate deacetylase isoform X2 n=1 Tax=Notamacropus eugenii TaxID=9315 RepID=UPI003B670BF2
MNESRVRLVVTGDDFGYCPLRDQGMVEAFLAGALTGVSLLVNGASADTAAQLARRHRIPAGLHANLSEGRPVSPGLGSRTSLIGPGGFFLGKMGLRKALAEGRVRLPEVREELRAQLSRFQDLLGQEPTHVDGHQHVHVLPGRGAPRCAPGVRGGPAGVRGPVHPGACGGRPAPLRVAGAPAADLRSGSGGRCPGR